MDGPRSKPIRPATVAEMLPTLVRRHRSGHRRRTRGHGRRRAPADSERTRQEDTASSGQPEACPETDRTAGVGQAEAVHPGGPVQSPGRGERRASDHASSSRAAIGLLNHGRNPMGSGTGEKVSICRDPPEGRGQIIRTVHGAGRVSAARCASSGSTEGSRPAPARWSVRGSRAERPGRPALPQRTGW